MTTLLPTVMRNSSAFCPKAAAVPNVKTNDSFIRAGLIGNRFNRATLNMATLNMGTPILEISVGVMTVGP